MSWLDLCMVILSVVCNVIAQFCIKSGMITIGRFDYTFDNILRIVPRICFSPSIMVGLLCFFLSIAIWFAVLSRVDVSVAYPFNALGYVLILFAAQYFFNEPITMQKVIGSLFVITGIFILSIK